MCSAAFWLAWPAFVRAVITEVTDLTMHQHPHRLQHKHNPRPSWRGSRRQKKPGRSPKKKMTACQGCRVLTRATMTTTTTQRVVHVFCMNARDDHPGTLCNRDHQYLSPLTHAEESVGWQTKVIILPGPTACMTGAPRKTQPHTPLAPSAAPVDPPTGCCNAPAHPSIIR